VARRDVLRPPYPTVWLLRLWSVVNRTALDGWALARGIDLDALSPDRFLNLVEHRIFSQSEETVERWKAAVETAEAHWVEWTHPTSHDRPSNAPSWWKGDEDAASVTQAGATTLRKARTRSG
jgi:hypothetical protein